MFDDIIVPKSYLTDILDKEDEQLFGLTEKFQTKDLENSLSLYKVSRNQLYKQVSGAWPADESKDSDKVKWEKTTVTEEINFYTTFTSKYGDDYWFEFKFKFVKIQIMSQTVVLVDFAGANAWANDEETEEERKERITNIADNLFKEIDKDNNGKLKKEDIKLFLEATMKKYNEKDPEAKFEEEDFKVIFSKFKQDENGEISR